MNDVIMLRKTEKSYGVQELILSVVLLVGTGYYLTSVGSVKTGLVVAVAAAGLFAELLFIRKLKAIIPVLIFVYIVIHAFSLIATQFCNWETESISVLALMLANDIFAFFLWMIYGDQSKRLWKAFVKVVFVLSVISIVGYYLVNIQRLVKLPIVMVGDSNTFYESGIIYARVNTSLRNAGIFWEPGMHVIILSLAALVDYYVNDKVITKKFVVLLGVSLFTVESTTGYILFIVLLSIVLLNVIGRQNKLREILLLLGTVVVAVLVFVYYDAFIAFLAQINPTVFEKVAEENVSYVARAEGPLINMKIFACYPLFGKGVTGSNIMFENLNTNPMIDTRVDTISTGLASYGIFGIIPQAFLIIAIFRQIYCSNTEKCLLCFFFLVMFFCEPLMSATMIPSLTLLLLAERSLLGGGYKTGRRRAENKEGML